MVVNFFGRLIFLGRISVLKMRHFAGEILQKRCISHSCDVTLKLFCQRCLRFNGSTISHQTSMTNCLNVVLWVLYEKETTRIQGIRSLSTLAAPHYRKVLIFIIRRHLITGSVLSKSSLARCRTILM